jgi:probable HAF family extracellular repeat protein
MKKIYCFNKNFNVLLISILVLSASPSQAFASAYNFTDLGTLGGRHSVALAINASGQIVGTSYTTEDAALHATVWNSTKPTDLGGLRLFGGVSDNSVAHSINDTGQIVGQSVTSVGDHWEYHATLWNGTTITDLGGGYSNALGINNSGQIVGWSSSPGGATIWNGKRSSSLGNLIGVNSGEAAAFAINSSGQIAGFSEPRDGGLHATLWNGATATDLGSLGGELIDSAS